MEKQTRDVYLSFACPKKWDDFKIDGDDRWCEKCQHKVVDFTEQTANIFDQAVERPTSHLCGRFKRSQMSHAFLKYVTASTVVVSMSCTPEAVAPIQSADTSGQIIVIEEDEYLTGIVLTSDSVLKEPDIQ